MKRALALLMMLGLAACGIKSDLVKPDGKATEKTERDPSRPPQPIGQ